MAEVLRIVSATVLLVLVAAGCGGAAQPHESTAHGVPRTLAREWEARASAIARAAAAGDSCGALQLASSLRDDVIAKQDELPSRVRLPLLTGVNSLANRLTCTQTVTNQTTPKKPKPPKPHERPGHHGHHGHGGDNGDNGDQG